MPEFNVATEFGIVGGSDETVAFEALRQHAIANPGSTYFFPPGIEYQYTTPKWLAEVQNVTILAYGASFNNLGAGTFLYSDMDSSVFLGSGAPFHDNQGTGQINPANADSGDLIEDTDIGDTTITFVTSGDSADYSVGDNIIIRWYSRQEDSFPPNPGFFEYNKVKSVGSGTLGVVTPLEARYKSQAPEFTSNPSLYDIAEGRARILNLNRAGFTVAGLINWYGGIGVDNNQAPNPNYDGVIFVAGVLECNIYGANFEGFYPATCKHINISDSEFKGNISEFDKIVERVQIQDSLFNNIAQGTGVKNVSIKGGSVTGTFAMRAKYIFMRDVNVHTQSVGSSAAQLTFDQYPRKWIDIDRCTFFPNSDQDAAILPGNATVFTPDIATETSLQINVANSAYGIVTQNCDIENAISLAIGAEPKAFFVTDISFDVSDNLILTGVYTGNVDTTLNLRTLWGTNQVTYGAHNVINGNVQPYDEILTGRRCWLPSGAPFFKRFKLRSPRNTAFLVNAYIDVIEVRCTKPYTGTDKKVRVVIQNLGLAEPFVYMSLNAKVDTFRRVDHNTTFGARAFPFNTSVYPEGGQDVLYRIPIQQWCQELLVKLDNPLAGNGLLFDDRPEILPNLDIKIFGTSLTGQESA